MHLRSQTIGALNMFRTGDGMLQGDDILVAQALADVATIAIIQHQALDDAATLNVQLNEALNSRVVIEQAKGKISEFFGLDMEQSFRRMRAHARNHNLRLTEFARDIVEGTAPVSFSTTSRPNQRPLRNDETPADTGVRHGSLWTWGLAESPTLASRPVSALQGPILSRSILFTFTGLTDAH